MSDAQATPGLPAPPKRGLKGWRQRLIASRRFQAWASRFPLTKGIAKREGEALFDLVGGFVHSQVLFAVVELRLLHMLMERPLRAEALAAKCQIPPDRMQVLLRAAVSLRLISERRDGSYDVSQRGAALIGVPGLEDMILHHSAFYKDLQDPVDFLRNGQDTELARFWPYVFGPGVELEPEVAERYSNLMADSQALVAEETLRTISLAGVSHLMDVGGGSGAFLLEVARAYPSLEVTLFDLPEVAPAAQAKFDAAGHGARLSVAPGSFRTDALPTGADAISLVRVLYDHADDTVADLLRSVFDALPAGGRVVVSEPMLSDKAPNPATDAYFAFYTMAMGTGKTRAPQHIARMLEDAGFTDVKIPRTHRPFVTSVVTAERPGL